MHSFITFKVVDFYLSILEELISEELIKDALEFASQFNDITEEGIIIQAKRSLLFSNETAWCKKAPKSVFDIPMGSFNGAETCELVGSYLLSKLSRDCQNNIGRYRDDGVDKMPRDIENVNKQICKTFSDHTLKVTIEANKKSVNYLDITLHLRSRTYKPFNKPGNMPQYVNHNSNHPPCIVRSLPESINRRLSNISSDRESFDVTIPIYKEALEKSGYGYKLLQATTTRNWQSQSNVRETETWFGLTHPTAPTSPLTLVNDFWLS